MRTYAKLFFISAAATLLLDLPFLIWHKLPAKEVAGFAATIALFGVAAAWSYSVRTRLFGGFREEWRVHFAIFPATFAVILQALVVAGFSFFDFGTPIPKAPSGRIMLTAGVAAFVLSLLLPRRLVPFVSTARQ